MTRSVIDPITRIEGHLRVEMEVENGVVADAWVSGGCFRGMELVVQNRTPEDAAQIVERICGVCPVSHAHASSIAGDKAYGITISNNARIIRNLLEGAQFLHSHILWLYNLAALDYVNPLNALQANVDNAYAVALENGLALHSDLNQLYDKLGAFAANGQLSIFSGNWFDADNGEAYKLTPELDLILTSHYLEALKMQARASEMAALLGGKMPHVMTSIPGGNMWVPTESKLDDLLAMAIEVRDWVNDTVLADTVALAGPYAEALFAVGLIAASFLAACVLPLTTAFVICEAFGWEAGVSFKWREAPTFKSIFTFVIAFSAIVVLLPDSGERYLSTPMFLPDVNLLAMMLTAQFVNGVILPILLAFMAIISADKRIMGAYRSRRVSKVLLWATVGVVAILTAVLLAMQVMGLA